MFPVPTECLAIPLPAYPSAAPLWPAIMTGATEAMMKMIVDLTGDIAIGTAVVTAAVVIGKSLFTDLTVQTANRI